MSELFFPVFGSLLILCVVVPLCALLGRAALCLLDRDLPGSAARSGTLRYLLLVGPPMLPVVWCVSAGLHQAESGRSVLACLVSHEFEQVCLEPLTFAIVLLALASLRAVPELMRTWRASRFCPVAQSKEVDRVKQLLAATPGLARVKLGRDLFVTEAAIGGSAALGWWRPVVVVESSFVRRCDDESLAAAIAHELEHVRRRDPLRYLLLTLAVRLNPLSALIARREAVRWIFEREVQCDRAAVLSGAAPLGLARALVQASRPLPQAVAGLGEASLGKLRLRVELLLSYAERRPLDDAAQGAFALLFACLIGALAVTLPHIASTGPLDALHFGIERVLRPLLK